MGRCRKAVQEGTVRVVLQNRQQAHTAIIAAYEAAKEQLQAGKKLVLSLTEESKTREQEQKYHAMIGEIAKQAQHLGAKWDSDDWKRLLVQKFCKDYALLGGRIIPNLDGDGIVQLDYQTRKFTKDQGSQFIEWLHAWGAENEIVFKE
jgi:hypothetical protein